MLKLNDFNDPVQNKVALSDFNTVAPKTSIVNPGTVTNVAAHAALLGQPEEVTSIYSAVTNELENGASSATLDNLLTRTSEANYSATLQALRSAMSDPAVTEEEKQAYLDGFLNMTNTMLSSRSLGVEVARGGQLSESEPDDNDETEFTRTDVGASLDEVDSYNAEIQKHVNAQRALATQSGWDSALNILETIVPFAEGAAIAEVRGMYEKGMVGKAGASLKSLMLLGESKDDLRNRLLSIPVEQRLEVARQFIRYVNSTGGSITLRPNELMKLNEISQTLMAGGYSNIDKFTDNLFSLLDSSFVLGPLARGAKGLTKASELATLRRGEEAAARVKAASTDIKDVVDETVIFVNSSGDASTNLNNVQRTTLPDGEQTVFVNPVGQASTDINEVSITEVIAKTQEMVTDRIITKLGVPTTRTPRSGDMGTMVDDLGIADEISNGLREDILVEVQKVLTPTSIVQDDIVKQVIQSVKGVLAHRNITTPKTFNATATQIVNRAIDESISARRGINAPIGHTSVSQTIKHVNPARYRRMHQLAASDPSGQMAKVLYGATSREAAMGNDLLPEIRLPNGAVRSKVQIDEAQPSPDTDMLQSLKAARGANELTKAEKVSARNEAKAAFKNTVGVTPRTPMMSIGEDIDKGVKFDVVYGPKDGGFRNAESGKKQVLFALRKYGVTEDELEVLIRDTNGEYVPMTKSNARNNGSYLVRVKYEYDISPGDPLAWSFTESDKLYRMFESRVSKTSGKQGGLLNFIPSISMIDKQLLNPASVAADRTSWLNNRLLAMANDYASQYKKLDKRQKMLVDAYVVEANNLGLKFNSANLDARGFSKNAIETVRSWKKVNDTLWALENIDLNKSLRAKGYWRLVDTKNDTDLIVRPMSLQQARLRDTATGTIQAFDSATGKIVRLKKSEVDELYERGGSLATTRGEIDITDEVFDTVIVRNSEEGYVRRIRDEDTTLNYRDGHYTVRYTDPYFIKKTIKKDGKTYQKAVATSGTLKDAESFVNRLKETDEEGIYDIVGDVKKDTNQWEELEWSSLVSGGRTSQRVRGDRLANATGQQTDLDHVHIQSPEESLVQSIVSMSNRAAHRNFVETAKARWMHQFGDLIEEQKGQKYWPTEKTSIARGDIKTPSSRVKDAKVTWSYIDGIDAGYVNLIDDWSKTFFRTMSQEAGREGWTWVERAADKASQFNPNAFARKKAFRFMLAANPLRQAPVQAMQALPVLMATNARMLMTGRLASQIILVNYLKRGGDVDSFMKIVAKNATGLSVKEAKQLADHYELSGFESAVKANSLIRDDLKTLVDRTVLGRVRSGLAKPLNFTQRIGFEAGENLLMRSVWLSEYDLLRRTGAKITPEVLENLNAKVRHLTLNMNKAGELPYNENTFSAIMQFFQAPHKAFAQIVLGHKGLSSATRYKLAASYITTFGIGANPVTDFIAGQMPNEPIVRDVIEGGLFNIMMNSAFSTIANTQVSTDFSDSFRLLEPGDPFKLVGALVTMNIPEVLQSSPSLGLVFGDNPRITNFVKQTMRAFTVPDRTPEELAKAGQEFLSIFSGMSNFFKAKYIWEHQKVVNNSGKVIDPFANNVEGLMKAAGFATMDEVRYYAFNEKSYREGEAFRNDVKTFVNETSHRLMLEGISNEETAYILDVMGEAQRVYGNDPFYLAAILDEINFRAAQGDHSIPNAILKMAQYTDESKLRETIATAPITPEQRENLLKIITMMKGSE